MDSKGKNIVDFGAARKNLRRKAKEEARTEKEKQAAENRIRFGRTGAEKKRDRSERDQQQKSHDDRLRDPTPPTPDKDPKND